MEIAKEDLALHMKELQENYQNLDEGVISTLARGATFGFEFFILGTIVDKSIFVAWRSATGLFSSASRKCGVFKKGDERAICLSKVRLQALNKKKSVLDRIMVKCKTGKNPDKCLDKISNEIEKNNARMEMERNNIIIIGKRIRLERMRDALMAGKKVRAAEEK